MMEEHDEEVTMFDSRSLLDSSSNSFSSNRSKRRKTKCQRLVNTFALMGAFFGVVSYINTVSIRN